MNNLIAKGHSIIYLVMAVVGIMTAVAAPKVGETKLQFRHYTTEEGVPSDCIRDIVQDDLGYLWFATDGGVTRFDGYNFKPYPLIPADSLQIDNFAGALHNSELGFWVGTDTHLYRYEKDKDSFSKYPLHDASGKEIEGSIRQIVNDKDGNMWIVIYMQGVGRISNIHSSKPQLTLYPFSETNKYVGSLYVDSRNDIWAVSHVGQGGLYRFNKSQNKFNPVQLKSEGKPVRIEAMALGEDADYNIWLGTWQGGLLKFNPYNYECEEFLESDDGRMHIHTLTTLADGWIMLGSDEGLHVVNTKNGKIYNYTKDELDVASLSDQFVYPIVGDAEGGVWIGTYYGGINYLQPHLKIFDKKQQSQFVNSVSGKVISGFAEDNNGNIFIASDDGGLSKYDTSTGVFTHIQLNPNGRDNLHALMINGDDLWIGSYGDGVYKYNIKTGKIGKVPTPEGSSSYSMLHDASDNLWVATDRWLYRYDEERKELLPVRELNALIVDMEEDHNGIIWICTQGDGLYRFNPKNSDWRNFRYNNSAQIIPHNHINDVTIDAKNNVWIGTVAGLAKYEPDKGVFSLVEHTKGLGPVSALVEDQNAIWLATAMGLAKYLPVEDKIEVFTRLDGLCSTQFMPNAMLKASNGRIFVGTRDGYTSFLPFQIRPNEIVAPVVITNVDIDNEMLEMESEQLKGSLNNDAKITLLPNDHSISIKFASLSYVNPGKNQYKYKLDGFDYDWILAGSNNVAYYTNLAPGKYKFRVKGSNSDNIWNDTETTLDIEVLAPWYLQWYMKLLYLVLIVGGVLLAITFYTKRSEQRHHEEIKRMKAAKEMEVYEAKMSFFTTVAHEIRTPVSLIIGPLEKLMHNPEKVSKEAASDLSVIERNSQRLLFLVNQLLDFKKVEEAGLKVAFTHCNLPHLLKEVTDRFRPALEQKGIQLTVACDVADDFVADVDAELMNKLISNLMNNARKFTKDSIVVTLSANPEDGNFSISVADNGRGLSKEDQHKVFMPFYQVHSKDSNGGTGLGLSIVQNVVEAHDGKITVESELGHGTTFIATMPIKQEHVVAAPAQDVTPDADQPAVAEPASEKVRLLIVEDNDELRDFVADSFADKYEVLRAADGEEAWSILQQKEVSLIISDWMMPNKDGVELLAEVRADKNYSHIPFVLLTAKTDNRSKIEGLNCGADAYVEKPFSMQVLQARIANLMNMRDMLRRKYSQKPLEPIESVAPNNIDSEFLTQLSHIIEENFSNPDLDVDFLAKKMDMSRSSLYAKIRSLVDVTPNDLIRITRLKNAARLLADGKYRINEVGYMVGFNSSSYFSKCFQKQFNMTPSEFVANR